MATGPVGSYSSGVGVTLATDQRGFSASSPPDIGAFTLGTIIVTDSADDLGNPSMGDITLPYAISQGPDIIQFAPTLLGGTRSRSPVR